MKTGLIMLFNLSVICCAAQDSALLKMLDDSITNAPAKNFVTGTFKGTYIINTQSVEAPAKNVLLFLVMHRFGKINDGAYQFFGLDNATMRLGFDYGITDRLSIGIGRSSFQKTFDGHLKYKLIRQTNTSPLTIAVFGGIYHTTLRYDDKDYLNATLRTSYDLELLLARKFTRNFSLQLTPSYLHYNLVPTVNDKNDVFALGLGGRMLLTRRISVNAEYNYLPPGQVKSSTVYSSLSAGIDIETGGHVFQLHITNSHGMVEPLFLGKTDGSWGKGDIYFGFNISRNFNLNKH